MNLNLALRTLDRVMDWDQERCQREFGWLSLMARFKYDGYRGFSAGARFVESLVHWLQQFQSGDEREHAYRFIQRNLVYLGPQEMEHLVELTFPEVVQRRLTAEVAADLGIPTYQVWRQPDAQERYARILRQCLFMGLSDGARMDAFRRANEGVINNEQVCVATEINSKKWESLRAKLRRALNDDAARFRLVMLIDDFTGSGTTLLRKEDDGTWDGKLHKFYTQARTELTGTFSESFTVLVHHYVATVLAAAEARKRDALAREEIEDWFPKVEFSYGTILPDNIQVRPERYPDFCQLIETYYDSSIETESLRKGGETAKYGFSSCRLPLVMEHNTPNNSVALLWAEAPGQSGRPMRPLFRRRQRHF